MPILQFERQDDSEEASYRYDPPNHYHFGDDPTLADPYESKNVEVSHCIFDEFEKYDARGFMRCVRKKQTN